MEDLVVSDVYEASRIFRDELRLIPSLVAFTGKFNGINALFEHDMFVTGSSVIFWWDNETGKFRVYDKLSGSHNCFILYPHGCRYAKSVDDMRQIVDRVKKELRDYSVFYNNIEVADTLSVLE